MVDAMSLVSVDLIIYRNNRVLLGRRSNRPAHSYWSVPGGRVFKDETITDIMFRILDKELSLGDLWIEARMTPEFQGIYQHFYSGCFAGDDPLVLSHRLHLTEDINLQTREDQHGELACWDVDELLATAEVHQYQKIIS